MTEARRSILAHLALTFTDRREVLATAGLGYLLSSSSLASGAVEDLLEQWGAPKVPALHYEVEVVDPAAEGRPDVLGLDAEGHRRLILEGKFWAGLTSNQPDALKGGNTLSNSRELVIAAVDVTLPDASADIPHLPQRLYCLPLPA
jgi:hypothetical protein